MGIFDKAKEFANEHADKVAERIDEAGDFVDEKTGGKYADTVDKVQEAAKKVVGGEQTPDTPPTNPNP